MRSVLRTFRYSCTIIERISSGESGETGVRDAVLRAPGGVVGPSAALASSAGRRRIVYRIVLHGWLRDLWTEDRYEHKGAWGKARMHGL